VVGELGRAHLGPGTADHERHDGLHPALVRRGDDGALGHRRMCVQGVLDLARVHVVRTAHDHVRGPVDEIHEPAVVEARDVTGAQPAVTQERRRVQLGRVQVARHRERRAHRDLAGLSGRHVGAVLIDEPDLGLHRRLSAGAERCVRADVVLGAQRRDADRRFCLAVVLTEDRSPDFEGLLDHRSRHRRCPVAHRAQPARVGVGGTVGQQDLQHGRHEVRVRHAVMGDRGEIAPGVEAVQHGGLPAA
jgi:hypothetical protein